MRFGSRILFENVSATFSPGRRYGLTGPNGSGKSTLMKLLAGDQPPQKGTIAVPGKLGVLRQDQFVHDACTVTDTVVMGNKRLWRALQERDAIYAKSSDLTDAEGMRLGELEGIVGHEDGYEAEANAATLLQGLDIPNDLHQRKMAELQGGQKVRVLLAQALFGQPEALLLDEPTNHLDLDSIHWLRDFMTRYEGTLDRRVARPALPQRRLHARRRHRLRDDHHLHGRLRRHGAGQDAGAVAHRGRQRAAREEDRAVAGLHRAVLGRHARQPGDVAQEGSGTAADDGAGAVEHPAPVHQVPDEPPVRPDSARVRRRHEDPRRGGGGERLQRHREPRREGGARRPQRRRQDDAAEGAARGRAGSPAFSR